MEESASSPAYQERPSAAVAGAVVWTRTLRSAVEAPVLPDGCMDLLWMDGALRVAGPDTRAREVALAAGTRISGIRFAPGTAPALLGVPAHELRDAGVELDALWSPADVRRAAESVAAADDPMTGLEVVSAERAAVIEPADPVVRWIAEQLAAGRSVAETATATGFGARRLHRLSLASFGYGPKTLARVLRLQHGLALSRAGVPFAEVAARAGYADQAHFAREVRDLTGMPLRRLLTVQGADQASNAA
ncbi:helix-turn-helix domain-containing protein [Nocardia otitidiscaviarum]|uniref:Helix-turn-helix transcriptional regulator n=1 Tax=Nocardia otitidiscaviarum TaxID=1823 RepID=A0A516NTT2_9NOCA|nr:AraC family transcriptional regulator [Nocardia otitidiscaviarum]MBF6179035.1 helix-turn-helix transcriptional regulator [Nocardia otitidiscaviarum]MCP9621663.1 AraC family transcriptional regulator [Nocardia otitidiscaviarum]QDP82319.1 helix-turn-helix transcriptional regulator [Nocardia otitidiscaviarum]